MAIQINQIGSFRFLRLECPPLAEGMDVERIERAGVDGIALLRLGVHDKPTRVRSTVDVATVAAGWQLYEQYKALQGADAVNLIWAGAPAVLVAIEKVTALACRPLQGSVGLQINPPSGGLLICEWILERIS